MACCTAVSAPGPRRQRGGLWDEPGGGERPRRFAERVQPLGAPACLSASRAPMTRRIHVVGSSPRTGTTLLLELLVAGFAIDASADHETSVFERPPRGSGIHCTKNPRDLLVAGPLLRIDRNLWLIHMVRDPRDVVVSRHRRDPGKYWTNLRLWKDRQPAARELASHPRFLTVRYEDLVREPDAVQDRIAAWMPFLPKRAPFSAFHRTAKPSEDALDALRGLRPIDTGSIGAWRRHKPRLAAQLALHGSIQDDLERLGYEEGRGVAPGAGGCGAGQRGEPSPGGAPPPAPSGDRLEDAALCLGGARGSLPRLSQNAGS